LVAVEDGTVVGAVQVVWGYLMPDTYIISWLCVSPELQRSGIGSAMMDYALRYISDRLLYGRRGTVYLSAAVGRDYYARWGFIPGPPNHHDAVIMLKVIN
jgi:ribosomal protein S18 acetylase RimI-like enzyme